MNKKIKNHGYMFVYILVSLFLISFPLFSKEPRILEWVDLAPEGYFEELEEQQGKSSFGIFDLLGDSFGDDIDDDSEEGQKAYEELQALLNSAPIVPELDGELIKLGGFIVPLEFDFDNGTFNEFLLAPYFGACIHVPPPPSNQIIYIKSSKPLKQEWLDTAVWATGQISTGNFQNVYGSAGYSMTDIKLEVYDIE